MMRRVWLVIKEMVLIIGIVVSFLFGLVGSLLLIFGIGELIVVLSDYWR